MKSKIPTLVSVFALIARLTYAQDSAGHTYPSAVLIELMTGQSRLRALKADKKYKELEEAKNDLNKANAAMILDYKTHFNYCPVYYFADTNQKFVLSKEFNGILLDADLKPVQNVVVNSASKDYVIAYYGYPTEQALHQKKATDSAQYGSNSGEPMGRGLIINNDKMQQLNYLYSLGYDNLMMSKENKKYSYFSKHFDIQYTPTAKEFNARLKTRKNKDKMRLKSRRVG